MRSFVLFALVALGVTGYMVVRETGVFKASGPQVGDEAPDFVLQTLNGKEVKLSLYRGEKGVVIDFFATWCPPCRAGVPHLIRFGKEYADRDIVVLGVNLDKKQEDIAAFAEKAGIPYAVLLNPDGSVAQQYGVSGIPTYIGVDKRGIIRHRGHDLPRDTDAFVEQLTK